MPSSSGESSQRRITFSSWTVWPWKWRQYDPLKCWELRAQCHCFTSQKADVASSSAVRMSRFERYVRTVWVVTVVCSFCWSQARLSVCCTPYSRGCRNIVPVTLFVLKFSSCCQRYEQLAPWTIWEKWHSWMWKHWFLCHGTNFWYLVRHFRFNQLSSSVALLLLDTCQMLFIKLLSADCTHCFMSQAVLLVFKCVCFLSGWRLKAGILENEVVLL